MLPFTTFTPIPLQFLLNSQVQQSSYPLYYTPTVSPFSFGSFPHNLQLNLTPTSNALNVKNEQKSVEMKKNTVEK